MPQIDRKILPHNVDGKWLWATGRKDPVWGPKKVLRIVMHTYDGGGRSLYNWWLQSKLSSHYAVFLDGGIEQYVEDDNTAWHAGNDDINRTSIGIEHQDNSKPQDKVRTDAQYESSAWLVAQLWLRHGVVPLEKHNKYVNKTCPGGLDVERIRKRAEVIYMGIKYPPVVNEKKVTQKEYDEAIAIREAKLAKKQADFDALFTEVTTLQDEVNSLKKRSEPTELARVFANTYSEAEVAAAKDSIHKISDVILVKLSNILERVPRHVRPLIYLFLGGTLAYLTATLVGTDWKMFIELYKDQPVLAGLGTIMSAGLGNVLIFWLKDLGEKIKKRSLEVINY